MDAIAMVETRGHPVAVGAAGARPAEADPAGLSVYELRTRVRGIPGLGLSGADVRVMRRADLIALLRRGQGR